jgi:hypothetical protein
MEGISNDFGEISVENANTDCCGQSIVFASNLSACGPIVSGGDEAAGAYGGSATVTMTCPSP